jgi:hypothetical protein
MGWTSRITGSRPPSARAVTSRASLRAMRRSVSSAAECTADSSSSRVGALSRGQLELRLEDGERRAELVARIGHERPLAVEGPLEPPEHVVQGEAEAAKLVLGRRQRQALAGLRPGDGGRPAPHGLNRREGPGGDGVAGEAREQEPQRSADAEGAAQGLERSLTLLEQDTDHHNARRLPGGGLGEEPSLLPPPEEGRSSLRPIELVGEEQRTPAGPLTGVERPAGAVEHAAPRIEHLAEAPGRGVRRPLAGQVEGLPVAGQGGEVAAPCAQRRVDSGVELPPELEVDEDADHRHHHAHGSDEGRGDLQPERDAA